MPIARRCVLALLVSSLFAGAAAAQPPQGPPTHVERRVAPLEGGGAAWLTSTWAPTEDASSLVLRLGDAAPVTLVTGSAPGAIEARAGLVLVAYQVAGDARPFRVHVAHREGSSYVLGAGRELARPGSRSGDYPFAVVIAPTPDGFAVFFEEVQSDDPSAARTYLFRLDATGAPLDAGREIAVPWPLVAAAWNGAGFHLALIYPGSSDGMRLSMVALSPEGQPRQHPDWSSPAGGIADVHLVAREGSVRVFYRGGAGGDHWLDADVTAIESWGSDRRHARDHGRVREDAAILIATDGTASIAMP